MQQHFPDFRFAKDEDYFVTLKEELMSDDGSDIFYHHKLNEYSWNSPVATVNELYTIKVSHIFWQLNNGSWNKHKNDIIFFQKNGAALIPDLFSLLYSIWEYRYGKKKANLDQEPDDFFSEQVKRIYNHDSIHASIAYYDEPLFNKILKDGSAIAVEKEKFDNLSFQVKLQLVWEEIYATALERKIIPSSYKENFRVAYDYALRQLLTSYSKGWFPLFVAENLQYLYKPDIDYVKKHKENKHKLIQL